MVESVVFVDEWDWERVGIGLARRSERGGRVGGPNSPEFATPSGNEQQEEDLTILQAALTFHPPDLPTFLCGIHILLFDWPSRFGFHRRSGDKSEEPGSEADVVLVESTACCG